MFGNIEANNSNNYHAGRDQHNSTYNITHCISPNLQDNGVSAVVTISLFIQTRLSEFETITNWLCPSLNFQDTQSRYFQEHEPGTGKWMIENQMFEDWRDGETKTLWCPGDRKIILHAIFDIPTDTMPSAGVGKTILV
jgi:hypothetical protein